MEKVTVKIGIFGVNSSQRRPKVRNVDADIRFLMEALDISHKRARHLVAVLWQEANHKSTAYITVDLDYKQLGKYTAKRMAEELQYYWKYPFVLGHEPCVHKPEPEQLPLELRPGKRTVP